MAAKRMMLPTAKPDQPTAEQPLEPSHCLRHRPSGLRLQVLDEQVRKSFFHLGLAQHLSRSGTTRNGTNIRRHADTAGAPLR